MVCWSVREWQILAVWELFRNLFCLHLGPPAHVVGNPKRCAPAGNPGAGVFFAVSGQDGDGA